MTTPAGPAARVADPGAFTSRVTGRIAVLAAGLPDPLGPAIADLARRPAKHLRPSLLWASAGFGNADMGRVVRLGAVVELIHLASLLHDDVIDRAATRRGEPAAHTRIGTEQAVLAGLGCLAVAGTEAAELGTGVARVVSHTIAGLSYGELLDVERAFDIHFAMDDYLELVQRKTGSLFRLGCLLGAAEAHLEPEDAAALAAFGHDFGVAFQILDDCLDLSDSEPGKPTGTDHLLGVFGAPTLFALAADSSGALAALLLAPSFGVADLPAVRKLVVDLKGLDAATDLAMRWYGQAAAQLDQLPAGAAKTALTDIVATAWAGAL